MNLIPGPDGRTRCSWCAGSAELLHYHDNEWGFPVDDDIRLFEKICLEGFQSGLSWRTILAKRENFRQAFCNFDFNSVARFTEADVGRLLNNAGIIRHAGKIRAAINNAKRAQEIVDAEGSLAAYVWRFEPEARHLPAPQTITTSAESIALANDLKRRGWQFVGPTTAFAFMQGVGLINDHQEGCIARDAVERARDLFQRPG